MQQHLIVAYRAGPVSGEAASLHQGLHRLLGSPEKLHQSLTNGQGKKTPIASAKKRKKTLDLQGKTEGFQGSTQVGATGRQ